MKSAIVIHVPVVSLFSIPIRDRKLRIDNLRYEEEEEKDEEMVGY